ncbi:MAG: glycoside hydrolase family 127 protein, partial [Anaerolineae bacterium]|nr:glycoside hydrolase family 127 protein [Anaerolineae bacterium]
MPSHLRAVPHKQVEVAGFWGERQEINRRETLPIEYQQLADTGRIAALDLTWKPGEPNPPHIFWESDIAKWIEAVGYSLAGHPDAGLERQADDVIDRIAKAQQPDGYLNIHFTVVEPEKRWTNLRDWHELYCAGHLMEAAVAYYEGTGKDQLLRVMQRYADHIDEVFGREPGQKRGYPGHEEIELGLVKLYRATGKERYLELARYFVDERGAEPHYFDIEARERGDDKGPWYGRNHNYNQSHLPLRDQRTAEGHAVRAMYLYAGATDIAMETGDQEALWTALDALWRNVTERRMYVTGGIGSAHHGERFTFDYHLPNDTAYAETCAAIGLVFWAHRMLQARADGAYADVMERALYNGVLSGVSLDGRQFFYVNPLEVTPETIHGSHTMPSTKVERQSWFGCACCPPNLARLMASLGGYVYSQRDDEVWVHLYTSGSVMGLLDGQMALRQETRYPWDEEIALRVACNEATPFTLALRIPGWCRGARLAVNGKPVPVADLLDHGYAKLQRTWHDGDQVALTLPMPVERVYAHPAVWENAGRVALQRGPLVYCLEEVDNGGNLASIVLPRDVPLEARWSPDVAGGVMTVHAQALRRALAGRGEAL